MEGGGEGARKEGTSALNFVNCSYQSSSRGAGNVKLHLLKTKH
jgi:hypothetical protein